MLRINRLSKSIKGKPILKELSCQIAPGEIAIFIGASGGSKTTLLRILNNLESYDSGTFFLGNNELPLALASKNHTVGLVFQHFNLFEHLTAKENITSALIHCKGWNKKSADNIACELLRDYDLLDKSEAAVSRLSGGQKQRLAIARTLALNPQIICLDEPTSALDPRLTTQVAKNIQKLAEDKRMVLLTTHDLGLVEQLEGILFLVETGSIAESATKKDYKDNPASYPKLHSFLQGSESSCKME